MQNYVIFTDSTCGFKKEQVKKFELKIMSLKFTIDNRTYNGDLSREDLTHKTFYNMLRKGGLPTTSQVNPSEFLLSFEGVLKEKKDILYIGFSSALSGTFGSALAAKKELENKYKDRKIILVDTLAGSSGQAIAAFVAYENKKKQMSIEENATSIEKIKLNICHWIILESLFYAKRGGRISYSNAFIGTILGVRAMLRLDDAGNMVVDSKIRGRKLAILKLLEEIKKNINPPYGQTIFISHADCYEDALYLSELVKKNLNVKEIIINYMDAIAGSHGGPGALGIFFIGKKR